MPDEYMIWSRFQRNTGFVVRACTGPYPTRAKAQTALKHMVADHKMVNGTLQGLETQVVKVRPASASPTYTA